MISLEDVANYFQRPTTVRDLSDFRFVVSEGEMSKLAMEAAIHPAYIHAISGLFELINPTSYAVIGVLFGTMESYLLQKRLVPRLETIVICDNDIPEYNPLRDNGSYAYRNICGTDKGDFRGEFVYIRADSTKTKLLSRLGPFDVVFVDGRHDEIAAEIDMTTAFSVLNPGGFLLVHDIDLTSSSVETGYRRWLAANQDRVSVYEVRHPEFYLGLGVIQKLPVDE